MEAAEYSVLPARDGLAAVTVACNPDVSDHDAFCETDGLFCCIDRNDWPDVAGRPPEFFDHWCRGNRRLRLLSIREAARNGVEEALCEEDYSMLLVVRAVSLGAARGNTTAAHVMHCDGRILKPMLGLVEYFPFAEWRQTQLEHGATFSCAVAIAAPPFPTRWFVARARRRVT